MKTPKKEKTGFTELEDKYWRALRLIQTHVNEPDVVKSIVDKAIGAEEDVIPIEEPEDNVQQSLEASLSKQSEPEEEQSNDYPDPGDVGGLIYNSTAKKRNALMRDWLEHNFNNDGFGLPKALFNRINDSVTKLTGPNKDPEDEAAFIDALNKEFKNDFVNDENDHFGEEQAEGLDNLLEGLRDTPHDNRW